VERSCDTCFKTELKTFGGKGSRSLPQSEDKWENEGLDFQTEKGGGSRNVLTVWNKKHENDRTKVKRTVEKRKKEVRKTLQ